MWNWMIYLFSLALCLKSSTAFRNSVTLKSPLSWSSNSNLEERNAWWRIQIRAVAKLTGFILGNTAWRRLSLQTDLLDSLTAFFTQTPNIIKGCLLSSNTNSWLLPALQVEFDCDRCYLYVSITYFTLNSVLHVKVKLNTHPLDMSDSSNKDMM